MKRIDALTCAVAVMIAVPAAAEKPSAAPLAGWTMAGQVNKYVASVDHAGCQQGRGCAVLRSTGPSAATDYGGLVQEFDADHYRGKRVRLSGFIRTEGVTGYAGLYLRVDGPDRDWRTALVTDLMENRPIKGTTKWTRYQCVVDIGSNASQVSIGSVLHGSGTLWADGFRFEQVSPDVPTTVPAPKPHEPVNLDYES